jgi:hypothetical protein
LSQINLENTEITQERFEWGSGVICFLGPSLTLRNCTLVLGMAARDLIIPQARFIDCTFIVKKQLKNFRWDTAHLQGCRFKGRFSGNDFGEWPSSPGQGSIRDCDFSEAHLDWSLFLNCDVRTIRFPPWPCFTILDPSRRWSELQALPWPRDKGPIIGAVLASAPPSSVALTLSASNLAKWCGTTPDAIKALVGRLDSVYY